MGAAPWPRRNEAPRHVNGGAGNDTLAGGGGNNDALIGGDTAVFSGNMASYTIGQSGTGIKVTDNVG